MKGFTRTLNIVKLLCNAPLVHHDIKCAGLPVVVVEEENDEKNNCKNERHFIPIPLDAVAPPQKRFQFFVALVDDEPGENDYGKPKFHYYFPHMETL